MLTYAAKLSEILPGGLRTVEIAGQEITLGNYEGKIYAVSRRCGHMNAPLEMGTLYGKIITCPLHYAQFDITTGKMIGGPVPSAPIADLPLHAVEHFKNIGRIMADIKTENLKTFEVVVEGEDIKIKI